MIVPVDERLKTALDDLLQHRDIQKTIANDPIQFAHQYKATKNREPATIFASLLTLVGSVSLSHLSNVGSLYAMNGGTSKNRQKNLSS